jgi:hypothetical protein
MEAEKLKEILRLHSLWLNKKPDGVYAELSEADLREVNLSDADLRDADLSGTYLSGVNLSDADLREVNLSDADLFGANLSDADLFGANLSDADLRGANLHGANLHGTNLSGASLHGANLHGTDLSGASLHGAKIAVISAGPMGRGNRITYYKYEIDEVDCGCFHGTLEEFAKMIEETHKNNPRHLTRYRAAVELFKTFRKEKDE